MFRPLHRDFSSSDESSSSRQQQSYLPLDRDFSPEEESSNFSSDSERSEASHVSGNSYSSMMKRNIMTFQTHCLGGKYKVESEIGKEEEDSSSAEDENEEEYEEVLQQSKKRAQIEHGELPSVVQEHMEIPMNGGYFVDDNDGYFPGDDDDYGNEGGEASQLIP